MTNAALTADMTPLAAAEAIASALSADDIRTYKAEVALGGYARIMTSKNKAGASKLLNSVAPARIRKQAPHLNIALVKNWAASYTIVIERR